MPNFLLSLTNLDRQPLVHPKVEESYFLFHGSLDELYFFLEQQQSFLTTQVDEWKLQRYTALLTHQFDKISFLLGLHDFKLVDGENLSAGDFTYFKNQSSLEDLDTADNLPPPDWSTKVVYAANNKLKKYLSSAEPSSYDFSSQLLFRPYHSQVLVKLVTPSPLVSQWFKDHFGALEDLITDPSLNLSDTQLREMFSVSQSGYMPSSASHLPPLVVNPTLQDYLFSYPESFQRLASLQPSLSERCQYLWAEVVSSIAVNHLGQTTGFNSMDYQLFMEIARRFTELSQAYAPLIPQFNQLLPQNYPEEFYLGKLGQFFSFVRKGRLEQALPLSVLPTPLSPKI